MLVPFLWRTNQNLGRNPKLDKLARLGKTAKRGCGPAWAKNSVIPQLFRNPFRLPRWRWQTKNHADKRAGRRQISGKSPEIAGRTAPMAQKAMPGTAGLNKVEFGQGDRFRT
jgi:hypothetical protein